MNLWGCLTITIFSLLGHPGIGHSPRISVVATLVIDGTGIPPTCVFAWIKDLNVGPETIELPEENRGKAHSYWSWH